MIYKHWLVCLVLLTVSSCFVFVPKACDTPQIVQFINNYQIPTEDLAFLVKTNLSSFSLPAISVKKVSFSQTKIKTVYVGGKSASPINPYSVQVSNEALMMTLQWTANVSKTFGHDSFTVAAQISQATVSYIKSYSQSQNLFSVTNVKIVLPSQGIVIKSINPGPKDA